MILELLSVNKNGEHILSIDDLEDELIVCDEDKDPSYCSSNVMGLLNQIKKNQAAILDEFRSQKEDFLEMMVL